VISAAAGRWVVQDCALAAEKVQPPTGSEKRARVVRFDQIESGATYLATATFAALKFDL
jgi:hypothetical protein